MSKIPFTKEHLVQLSGFIDLCKNDPKILLHPDLAFFKNYIESLGGKIPAPAGCESDSPKHEPKKEEPKPQPEAEPELEVESEESDIELDNTGVIGMCNNLLFGNVN